MLKRHPVFKYRARSCRAAGDGRSADDDLVTTGKSPEKVQRYRRGREVGGSTISSVGQLTTGVTVPEWTAVIMLSNVTSPSLHAGRVLEAQNPCGVERSGAVLQKKNAYIFDFAPERTLTVYDAFANNLSVSPSWTTADRQENIKRLLNLSSWSSARILRAG